MSDLGDIIPDRDDLIAETRETAIEAFIKRKEEFDLLLERLTLHSVDYFGVAPNDMTWGHVGSLVEWVSQLRRVSGRGLQGGGIRANEAALPRSPCLADEPR